jgi:hypothetical protein
MGVQDSKHGDLADLCFFLISPKNVKTSGNLGAKRTLSALSWGFKPSKTMMYAR